MKNGEWLQEQVEKRQAAKTRNDEDAKTKSRERQREEAKDHIFRTVMADLRLVDKRLAQLEARQLARMNRGLMKLDDNVVHTEFETRGRKRAPRACTATTDLNGGSTYSKRALLETAARGRFASSLDALPEQLVVLRRVARLKRVSKTGNAFVLQVLLCLITTHASRQVQHDGVGTRRNQGPEAAPPALCVKIRKEN